MSQVHPRVYCSANRIVGTSEEIENEIRKILAAARANNARSGLTGALMFNAGRFGQVLEGAPETLELILSAHSRTNGTATLRYSTFRRCRTALLANG